jgi:hypothetical protein
MKSLVALVAAATVATAARAKDSGCAIAVARTDSSGVATFTAVCRWPVAPRWVAEILGEPERIARVSSSLTHSARLPDGRVVNVHSPGWPIADRQSTLQVQRTPLEAGGLLMLYALAPEQAPLADGRIQARRDDGRWEIKSDGNGGTLLLHETSYDAGGSLPVGIVQRTVRSSLEESLAEIRAAAERDARTAAR